MPRAGALGSLPRVCAGRASGGRRAASVPPPGPGCQLSGVCPSRWGWVGVSLPLGLPCCCRVCVEWESRGRPCPRGAPGRLPRSTSCVLRTPGTSPRPGASPYPRTCGPTGAAGPSMPREPGQSGRLHPGGVREPHCRGPKVQVSGPSGVRRALRPDAGLCLPSSRRRSGLLVATTQSKATSAPGRRPCLPHAVWKAGVLAGSAATWGGETWGGERVCVSGRGLGFPESGLAPLPRVRASGSRALGSDAPKTSQVRSGRAGRGAEGGPLTCPARSAPPSQPPDAVRPAALQVPPVQRAHQSAPPVRLHQVREPLPGGEAHHPGRAAQRQPAEERGRGAAAAGRGVPAAELRRQHRHPGGPPRPARPAAALAPRGFEPRSPGLLPSQATVLEEMPPFPERESSILAKLKKKKGPSTVTGLEEGRRERGADVNGGPEPAPASATVGPLLVPVPCTSSCASRPRGWEPAECVPVGGKSLSHTKNVCQEPGGGTKPEASTCASPGPPRSSSRPDTPVASGRLVLSRLPWDTGAPASSAGRPVWEACLRRPAPGRSGRLSA